MGSGWYVSGEDWWVIEGWVRLHWGGGWRLGNLGCGAGKPVRKRGRERQTLGCFPADDALISDTRAPPPHPSPL